MCSLIRAGVLSPSSLQNCAACCMFIKHRPLRTVPLQRSDGKVQQDSNGLCSLFIGKSQDQWDIHLQQIAGALRASGLLQISQCWVGRRIP